MASKNLREISKKEADALVKKGFAKYKNPGNYEREFNYYKIIFESKSADYILNFLSDRSLLKRAIAYIPCSQANARKKAAKEILKWKRLGENNLEKVSEILY